MYPPRDGDLPRDELMQAAKEATAPGGQWPGAEVYFKFTCEHCGNRCMFQEPNMLYEFGECSECGEETKVDVGGFTVHMVLDPGKGGQHGS